MNNNPKILLLEDDEMLAQTMRQFLRQEGYDVTLVHDGEDAIEAAYNSSFDLYLFDINVPVIDGTDTLKLLREANDETPTFFITALHDIDSVSKGFNSGCDDYIKKPFDMDELLIRIGAMLKKKNPVITYKNATFDLLANRVFKDGKEVDLGMVEKSIFALLLRNIGTTVEKGMFFEYMNKPSDAGVRVLVSKLKRLFDLEVTNIKGVGYRLEKL